MNKPVKNQHFVFQAYQSAWNIGEKHVYLYSKEFGTIEPKAIRTNFSKDYQYEIDKNNPTNEFENVFSRVESEISSELSDLIKRLISDNKTILTNSEKTLILRLFFNLISKNEFFIQSIRDTVDKELVASFENVTINDAHVLSFAEKMKRLSSEKSNVLQEYCRNAKTADEKIFLLILKMLLDMENGSIREDLTIASSFNLTKIAEISGKYLNVNVVVSEKPDVVFSNFPASYDERMSILLPLSPHILAVISLITKSRLSNHIFRVFSLVPYTYDLYASNPKIQRICANNKEALLVMKGVYELIRKDGVHND